MAGAFSRNGMQYDDYDDEEDEELNEEDEELETEEEGELDAEIEMEENASKFTVKNKVERLSRTIKKRFFPSFTQEEKRLLNRAKKLGLKSSVNKAKAAQEEAMKAFWAKVKSVLSTVGPFVLIFGLIIVAAIAVVSILSTTMPWLFGNGGNGNGDSGMSTMYGVNGSDFYGTRVVYKDADLSRAEIIEDYAGLVNSVILEIENTSVTGATLDVTINMPSEDYDWSTMTESAYSTDYAKHYDLVKLIATSVHGLDMVDAETSPTDLVGLVDNIGHFGFSTEMIEPIATQIKNYLKVDGVVTINPTASGNDTSSIDKESIINTAVDKYINDTIAVQTERYYIKDYLFADDDDMMSNISKEQYVTMIFMAKNTVTFNSFSFIVNDTKDTFNVKIMNGEQEITLAKAEYLTTDDGNITWQYSSSSNLNISTDAYQNLGDLDLSSGKSLYDIASTSTDNTKYVTANKSGVYTYLNDGVRVVFDSDVAFRFAENETKWQ